MIGIGGMIEHRDAIDFVSKWALDVAPSGLLLFTVPAPASLRVEMRLPRIRLVPGHSHGQAADKELAELHVVVLGAKHDAEIYGVGSGRFRSTDSNRVFLFQNNAPVRRDQSHQRAPTHV